MGRTRPTARDADRLFVSRRVPTARSFFIQVACSPSGPTIQRVLTESEPSQRLRSYESNNPSTEDSCFDAAFDRCGILSASPGRFPRSRLVIAATGRRRQAFSLEDTAVSGLLEPKRMCRGA